MGDRRISFLVKLFERPEYADQFMAGGLYLNRLSFFKRIENAADLVRGDPYEGTFAWLQPRGLRISMNPPGMGPIEITDQHLTRPVSISMVDHDDLHALCTYAVHSPTFDVRDDGRVELTPELVAELVAHRTFDDRCREFGQHAVVMHAKPFLDRLASALDERRLGATGRLVEYYDDETFNGEFALQDAPFRKHKRFEWQREFRVCVRTDTHGDDPLRFEMGDISDIAFRTCADHLNEVFKLDVDALRDQAA